MGIPVEEFDATDGVLPTGVPVTLDVRGKRVVIPTGDEAVQIGRNEWQKGTGNGDTPWGGAKEFSAPPDNLPGTVRILGGDNCYLMPVDQSVKSKVLHSGYLSEKGALAVDTGLHTLTEEFTIVNEGSGEDVTVIDACDSVTGWSTVIGTGDVTVENGRLKVVGNAAADGRIYIKKTGQELDISGSDLVTFKIESTKTGNVYSLFGHDGSNYSLWTRFPVVADTETSFVLPFKAPAGATGALPDYKGGSWDYTLSDIRFGITGLGDGEAVTFYIDNITACNGTLTTVECAVPDNTRFPDATINGALISTYNPLVGDWHRFMYYDGNGEPDGMHYLDGTTLEGVVAAYNPWTDTGYSIFPLTCRGGSVDKLRGDLSTAATASDAYGTVRRFMVELLMPPSDDDRTDINKVQLKLVTYYDDDGKTTIGLADDDDLATGLQHMRYPVIIIYDEATSVVDYYVSTGYLNGFKYTQDENGDISSIEIDPGNSIVYHGQTFHSGTSQDGDADGIPDFLEIGQSGSVLNYLKCNDFVPR